MSQYLKITIPCDSELQEILIAELSFLGYDSFQEVEKGIEAFINEDQFENDELKAVLDKYHLGSSFDIDTLQNINWNAEWEKNFDPIYIAKSVQIRASFHEKKQGFDHDIIINPKMSFGTGHHETTHLMATEQLSIDHQNKKVLDVGTGTGILSILAAQLGAKSIVATDIDEWSISNCRENFDLNKVQNFEILHGTIDKLTLADKFDIILANINKNVLIKEIPLYVDLLVEGGKLVLSGFYIRDKEDLMDVARQKKLNLLRSDSRNDWSIMVLQLSRT